MGGASVDEYFSDMTINQFRQLAAYNRWANSRLYAAALDLSDQGYRLHIGVFFGSLHGTLTTCC
jgi:uncharacterized damage-inducible protein DinB